MPRKTSPGKKISGFASAQGSRPPGGGRLLLRLPPGTAARPPLCLSAPRAVRRYIQDPARRHIPCAAPSKGSLDHVGGRGRARFHGGIMSRHFTRLSRLGR
ncbi:Protein of unknown function [Gryllus bimaculatus]|nr:Protein of unknown function [Gryllus bimaculatus]